MIDLQQLIAIGPVEAEVSIPIAVLMPARRRLRHSGPHIAGARFTDRELSQLRRLGLDLDAIGV